MSKNEKVDQNVYRKVILLRDALNTEKMRQKLTAYFFHFCVIHLGVFSVDKYMNICQPILPKNPRLKNENPFFDCNICYFSTVNKRDFERHEKTKKHIKRLTNLSTKKTPDDENLYKCEKCDRIYKEKSGLWRHTKKCEILPVENSDNSDKNTNDELLLELIKQNKELQQILIDKTDEFQNTMIEQNNKIIELTNKPTIINNTMNNTNQQFNLNLFLNETCKDALNIMDVLNSLQLKVEDFEETGRLGYVEGISRIIINCIKDMDVEKRPMHCTDFKRETLYIKDETYGAKKE
jgi:uncharacterized C2H2 Zn-finger protein